MAIENLIENVDSQIIKIRTKSLDVSFNELYDMYQNKELTISPDYQRLFRWEEEKQSRFVESLILEMPVPPIFVIETDDDFLVLHGCDIVDDLNGLTFDKLPKALQIKIKRSFVRMEVIKKESEISLKYHMFKRLNTGGELLSAQEIRNCTIRLLGSDGIDFLEECSKNQNFKSVINRVASEKRKTRYDQELILRFFAIKNDIENYKYPVTEYLTRYLEKITTGDAQFDYEKEKNIFEQTFKFINDNWGEEIFSGKTTNGNMRNEFVLYYFDGIAISLASLIDRIILSDRSKEVVECVDKIKYGTELQSYKTGSVNGVKSRIKLFTEGVEKVLDGR